MGTLSLGQVRKSPAGRLLLTRLFETVLKTAKGDFEQFEVSIENHNNVDHFRTFQIKMVISVEGLYSKREKRQIDHYLPS